VGRRSGELEDVRPLLRHRHAGVSWDHLLGAAKSLGEAEHEDRKLVQAGGKLVSLHPLREEDEFGRPYTQAEALAAARAALGGGERDGKED